MKETAPALYEEATACVAGEMCGKHVECVQRGGNRYNAERERRETPRRKFFKKNIE